METRRDIAPLTIPDMNTPPWYMATFGLLAFLALLRYKTKSFLR